MSIVFRRATALAGAGAVLLLAACAPSSSSSVPAATAAGGSGGAAPASSLRSTASTAAQLAAGQNFTGSIDVPPETVPVACPPITTGTTTVPPDAITVTGTIVLNGTAKASNNGDFDIKATFDPTGLKGQGWEEVMTSPGTWMGSADGSQYSFTGGGTVNVHVNHNGNSEFDVKGSVTVGGTGPDVGDSGTFTAHVRYDPIKGRMFSGNVNIKFTNCAS